MRGEREEVIRYIHLEGQLKGGGVPYLRGKQIERPSQLYAYVANNDNATER